MRALLKDDRRQRIGEIEIDLAQHATRMHVDEGDRDIFLNWEGAVDDAGQLRKCLSCGCSAMYVEKAFPQITGFVVVLAFTGAALGLLGNDIPAPVLIAMTLVLILDVAILVFSRVRLVCYQCRSIYRDLTIARYHRSWDRSVAERHPAQLQPQAGGEPQARAAQHHGDADDQDDAHHGQVRAAGISSAGQSSETPAAIDPQPPSRFDIRSTRVVP